MLPHSFTKWEPSAARELMPPRFEEMPGRGRDRFWPARRYRITCFEEREMRVSSLGLAGVVLLAATSLSLPAIAAEDEFLSRFSGSFSGGGSSSATPMRTPTR
jgi:hypothetical protein